LDVNTSNRPGVDSSIPVGDSAPTPLSLAILAGVLWVGWLGFLVCMLVL
jgi:hypothetical protein